MEGLTGTFFSFCILGVLLLLGQYLRIKLKLFQYLFLPSSIIAGFIGLFMGPYILDIMPRWIYADWSQYSGLLINIVFASLFLGVVLPKGKTVWRKGGPMLCFGVVMGLGQYIVALLVTVLILTPFFNVPEFFGCILEIGFSGGHGTAAGMKLVFNDLGYPAGGALGMMSATVGIIFAVGVGIVIINVAIRKGACVNLNAKKGIPFYKKIGLLPRNRRHPVAIATVATESIEPLSYHFGIVAVAILVGWGLQTIVKSTSPVMSSFPLFPLAMIGGLIVQGFSLKTKIAKFYDKATFNRIMGWSLDFLVASAIASLRLDLFLENFFPFAILMLAGMTWLVFMAWSIAPRMFPEYFFERGITEFGMQAGVTAVGLLLLRLVDPEYNTGTAEAFGLKQMVYEPFLGGGLITATAPIFIAHNGVWPTIIISIIIVVVFLFLSICNGWFRLTKWPPGEG